MVMISFHRITEILQHTACFCNNLFGKYLTKANDRPRLTAHKYIAQNQKKGLHSFSEAVIISFVAKRHAGVAQ